MCYICVRILLLKKRVTKYLYKHKNLYKYVGRKGTY
nr:MAG TPA: hypothetical protein [Caudoviricetes sp.]